MFDYFTSMKYTLKIIFKLSKYRTKKEHFIINNKVEKW